MSAASVISDRHRKRRVSHNTTGPTRRQASHSVQEQSFADDSLAGQPQARTRSSQAGFLPVPLGRIPLAALQSIPVYLRSSGLNESREDSDAFVLYRSRAIRFNDTDRERLTASGVKFVYVPVSEHGRLQVQTEAGLAEQIRDPRMAKAEAAALVYETSLELVN